MSTPEKNTQAKPDGELHAMLCAYLLGEADANETATVEKALAESSDLRAERERLEQTMGLVREAFPTDEALSDSALADVLVKAAAASGPDAGHGPGQSSERPRLRLVRSGWMRAAAAVMLVGIGAWTLQRIGHEAPDTEVATFAPDDLGAVSEGPARASELAKDADEPERRQDRTALRAPADAAGKKEAEEKALLRAIGYADSDESDAIELTEADAEALKGLGYGGEAPSDPPASAPAPAEQRYLGPLTSVAPSAEAERQALAQADGAVVTGSDTFFLGRGEKQQVYETEGDPDMFADSAFDDTAFDGTGSYRGAGDTVPPSGQPARAQASTAKQRAGEPIGTSGGAGGVFGARMGTPRSQEGGGAEGLASSGTTRPAAEPEPVEVLDGLGYGGGDDGAAPRAKGWGIDRPARVDREAWIREQCEVRIRRCYPRPQETPRDMYFRFWGDNAFQLTQLDALSTFSVDVDTASYALARRYLAEGHLPTKAQIRTEEFLNYFDPDLAPPAEGTFAIHTELAPSRFGGSTPRSMLRVGIRGREVAKAERSPLSLTFVIDTSGSMRENGRLELVKHAVRLLVGELDGRDSIAIVAYSNDARVVLPLTPASQGGVIEAALYPLQPNGSTNAEAGLKLAYEIALTGLDPERNHRVVFLSDGVANVGQTDQDRIAADVKRHRDAGIYLNTIGVGMNNHNDVFLEQLADKGDGVCDYVDSPRAAQRAIVERFTGAFEPIASDVKVQVEFDPQRVHRYRLLGYENRAIADADFRNDAVDAGEVGAGHQVVALYELELAGTPGGDPGDGASEEAASAPLATVRLRYKAPKRAGGDPREADVTEIERPVRLSEARTSFAAASPGYRRSAVVAQFAEFLRRSTHTYEDSFEALLAETAQLAQELADPDFDEFLGMVRKAYQLGPPADYRGELDLTLDEFRRFQILRRELEVLNRNLDGELLEELQRRNRELEDRLRDLIRGELDENG